MAKPEDTPKARRKAPGWVRTMSDNELHGLALRLRAGFWSGALSVNQDWLLDMAINELEYRHRRAVRTPGARPCVCELCLGPF